MLFYSVYGRGYEYQIMMGWRSWVALASGISKVKQHDNIHNVCNYILGWVTLPLSLVPNACQLKANVFPPTSRVVHWGEVDMSWSMWLLLIQSADTEKTWDWINCRLAQESCFDMFPLIWYVMVITLLNSDDLQTPLVSFIPLIIRVWGSPDSALGWLGLKPHPLISWIKSKSWATTQDRSWACLGSRLKLELSLSLQLIGF